MDNTLLINPKTGQKYDEGVIQGMIIGKKSSKKSA